MLPLVSIIIPSYNHAAFLETRIESILKQTFQNFEIIILDDCSTDESRVILERYKFHSKVKHLIYGSINSGSTFKQWIKGFNLALGKYIWIAESDDYCALNFLEEMVNTLEQNKAASIAYCKTIQVDKNGSKLSGLNNYYDEFEFGRWEKNHFNNGIDEIRKYLYQKNTIPNASAVVFRKSCLDIANSQILAFRLSGDWLFWIMLLEKGEIHYSINTINYFRLHSNTVRSASAGTSVVSDEQISIWGYLAKKKIIQKETIKALYFENNLIEPSIIQKKIAFFSSNIKKLSKRVHDFKFRIIQSVKRRFFLLLTNIKKNISPEKSKVHTYVNIGILYICVGKYDIFFMQFYRSFEKYFLNGSNKTYFVFTDSTKLTTTYREYSNIHFIQTKKIGWPYDTLLRNRYFNEHFDKFLGMDYLIFCNANLVCHKKIYLSDLGLGTCNKTFGVLQPYYFHKSSLSYPVESKLLCNAYFSATEIPQIMNYFQGCFYGGVFSEFKHLVETIYRWTEEDLLANKIPVWHDESYLNRYFFLHPPHVLHPGFSYPDDIAIPFKKYIRTILKSKEEGHTSIRS